MLTSTDSGNKTANEEIDQRKAAVANCKVEMLAQSLGNLGELEELQEYQIPVRELRSTRSGVNKHTEHMADVILDVAPGAHNGTFPGLKQYSTLVHNLIDQVKRAEFNLINEKFDGSPAILLGFDSDGRPFVCYKGGLNRAKSAPVIVRTVKEAQEHFKKGHPMREILSDCIRVLRNRIGKFPQKDLVFQADLLFTPSNEARAVAKDVIQVKANPWGIRYDVPSGSRFFPFIKSAKVGLVVHSVGARKIDDQTGAISQVEAESNPDAVEAFVKAIRSPDVFAIDPWSRNVALDTDGDPFTEEKRAEIERTLHDINQSMQCLSPEFRDRWAYFEPQFRVFCNAALKEGGKGGIYQAAERGEFFDFDKLMKAFSGWIENRSNTLRISKKGNRSWQLSKKFSIRFEAFRELHGTELYVLMKAYFDANRIQYALKPHMQAVYQSKLGSQSIEGVMLGNDEVIVKLVDRLKFSRDNFKGEKARRVKHRIKASERIRKKAPLRKLSGIYRKWRPGAIFYPLRAAPPHAGHIANIAQLVKLAERENRELFILPTNVEPDLEADHYKDLGVAKRKMDIQARDYDRPFSNALREEMMGHLELPDNAEVHFLHPSLFWKYVGRAKDNNRKGKVQFAFGDKDYEVYKSHLKRFDEQVQPIILPMKQDGLSATQVRGAIQRLSEIGDIESYRFLLNAIDYIPANQRDRIIGQLVHEWNKTDAAAQALI